MSRVILVLFACQVAMAFEPCSFPLPSSQAAQSPALMIELGHFRQVEAMLAPVADAQPGNAAVAALLSRAKAALGELEPALKLAEKAVLADDSNAAYHVQVAAVAGRMAEKASLFKQLGFAKRAKKELDAALSLDPRNLDALYGLMLYYYAAPSFIGGDKQKAQELADAMTLINPARGSLAQAQLARDRNDFVKEEEFYKKAIEANPQFYEAKTALSGFYLRAAKPNLQLARTFACEALAIDPGGAQSWKNLAQIAALDQCWTELDSIVSEAAGRNPLDLAPSYVAGITLLRMGRQLEAAESYLRRYLTQPPDGSEPSPGSAHWQLANVLEKLDRRSEALAELERALELEPSLEGAKKDLKRLKTAGLPS